MQWTRFVVLAGVGVALGSAVAGCGGSTQITADVRALSGPPSLSKCVEIAERYIEKNESRAREICVSVSPHANWYHAQIRYEGGETTWVACAAEGYDRQGRKLWSYPWALTLDPASSFVGASAAEMKPGSQLSVTWFLLGHQRGPVTRYVPTCKTEKSPPV